METQTYAAKLDKSEREFLARAQAERAQEEQRWLECGKAAGRQIERDLAVYNRSHGRLFAFVFGVMTGFVIALWITARILRP